VHHHNQSWPDASIAGHLVVALAITACGRTALPTAEPKDAGISRPALRAPDAPMPELGTGGASGLSGTGGQWGSGGTPATDAQPGSGGFVGLGGQSSNRGRGGRIGDLGGYYGAGYGGRGLDWSAGTGGSVSPCGAVTEIPADAKPLCTFTGDVGRACD